MDIRITAIIGLAALCFGTTDAQAVFDPEESRKAACPTERQEEASARLKVLHDDDQRVRREGHFTGDEDRRLEVAHLFAQGCLQSADDFYHSALIFQHGTVPEHYMLANMFALRAKALGHKDADWLIPRTVDRYLMKSGYKQLYATNAVTNHWFENSPDRFYYCLWPTENRLSDDQKTAAGGRSYDSAKAWIGDLNARKETDPFDGVTCPFPVPSAPEEVLVRFESGE